MKLQGRFARADRIITGWMARHAVLYLRVSIGLVFIWFGALKFFPGLSPADELATETIGVLTGGLIEGDVARLLLATVETAIGLGLMTGKLMRLTLLALFGQMLGTITPLLLFPDLTFETFPHALTLEGQYIVKNIVLISAGLAIGATVRGGGLVDDPAAAEAARAHDQATMSGGR